LIKATYIKNLLYANKINIEYKQTL